MCQVVHKTYYLLSSLQRLPEINTGNCISQMRKLRLKEAKICPRSHSQWVARAEIWEYFFLWLWTTFYNKNNYSVSNLFYKRILTYRFLHQSPLILVHIWSLGSVEVWPTSGKDRRPCQRGDPGPGVWAAHGREGRGWVSAFPGWLLPEALSETFSHAESLWDLFLVDSAPKVLGELELGGFRFQLYRFPAVRPT